MLNNKIIKNFYVFTMIITFVFLSMFNWWEMGGETWGYWYFSEIYKDSGDFIVFDRSPIYILYLNLFNWLSYPFSIYTEYLITTGLCVYSLFLFSNKFMNTTIALIAASLFIPFLQLAEPPVQKLALSFSLFALLIRFNKNERKNIIASYSLLLLAYCFRQTYLYLILTFLIFDLIQMIKMSKKGIQISFYPQIKTDWSLFSVLILFTYFITNQSDSNWNNVWFTDTTWFPTNGNNMTNAGGLQILNMFYILKNYGTFAEHDFYETNRVVFNNSKTYLEAIFANSSVFFQMITHNIKIFIPTLLSDIFNPNFDIWVLKVFYKILIFFSIFYGALKFALKNKVSNFFFGSCLLLLVLIFAQPKARYFLPVLPIFIMSTCYYASFVCSIISFKIFSISEKYIKQLSKNLIFLLLLSVLSFANFDRWGASLNNFFNQINVNELSPLTNKKFSMAKSFLELKKIASNCHGIISLESLFLGSFLKKEINYYSIFELPPFGNLTDNSFYSGLNISRINCVFISNSLSTTIGGGTNIKKRYENYILPYIDNLVKYGAEKITVKTYGKVYILNLQEFNGK